MTLNYRMKLMADRRKRNWLISLGLAMGFCIASRSFADTGYNIPNVLVSETDGNPRRRPIQELEFQPGQVTVSGTKATINAGSGSGFTAGAVLFADDNGNISSNSPNFVYDSTNSILSIDTIQNANPGFTFSLQAQNGIGSGVAGDSVQILPGSGSTGNAGSGSLTLGGATAAGTGIPGATTITAGIPTNANGGTVAINATSGVGSNKNGGDVSFTAGLATGLGVNGGYKFSGSGGGTGKLDFTALGSNRTFSFVDVTGTVAISTSMTDGSIFYSSGTHLVEDNSNLFYDAVNHRLGVQTKTDFGSGSDTYAISAGAGNIKAARFYTNTFRDITSFNTWFSITGTSPNQTMTMGNTGISNVVFNSKLSGGLDTFNSNVRVFGVDNTTAQFQLYGSQGQSSAVQIFDIIDSTSSGSHLMTIDKNGLVQVPNTFRANNGIGGTSYLELSNSGFTKVTAGTTLGTLAQISTHNGSAALGLEGVSGRPFNMAPQFGIEAGSFTTTSASFVPLMVTGASGQTANLQNWSKDGTTTNAFIDNIGDVVCSTNGNTTGFYLKSPGGVVGSALVNDTVNGDLQIGNGTNWNGTNMINSTSLHVNGIGETGLGFRANSYGARLAVQQNTSKIGEVIYAAATTPGDLLDLDSNAGTPLVKVSSNGIASVAAGTSTSYARVGGTLFDHYVDTGNVGMAETDLYIDSVPANTLSNNGDKISATYGGTFTGAVATTNDVRVYLGTTTILDSGFLSIGATTDSWGISGFCIRETSAIARCSFSFVSNFATTPALSSYVRVGGLNFASGTILKVTGASAGAGVANNQVVASSGYIEWKPAQ